MGSPSANAALTGALQDALAYARSGRLTEAENILQAILSRAPEHPDALQFMGLVRRGQGDNEAAVTWFKRSLKQDGAQAHVHNNMGNALLALGLADEAIASYRTAIRVKPDYADALLNLGIALTDSGDHQEACTVLRSAMGLAPQNARIRSVLGTALREAGKMDDAIATQREAVRLAPDHVPALHNLAVSLTMSGQPQEALDLLDRCISLAPNLAEVHYNRGNALYNMDRVEEAAQAYERALAIRPDYLEGHDTLNKLYWQHGYNDQYLESYRQAVMRAPRCVGLWVDWADWLNLAGRSANAETVLKTALGMGLDHPDIYHRLGKAHFALGRKSAGMTCYNQALGHEPGSRTYRLDMAHVLIQSGDYVRALNNIEEVLGSSPYDQEAIAYQGVAWRLLDDPREPVLNDYETMVKSYMIEPSEGYGSIESFNERLREVLIGLHKASRHPVEQTLRGGSQTMGSLFAHDIPEIQLVRQQLEKAIAYYIADMPDDSEHILYRRKAAGFRFSGSWSVHLKRQGFHVNHVHTEGWISSCYYVALPDAVERHADAHEGWIKFGETNMALGERERIAKIVKPEVGKLVLFPSYIYHGTVPFDDDKPRTTIAFDVVPE